MLAMICPFAITSLVQRRFICIRRIIGTSANLHSLASREVHFKKRFVTILEVAPFHKEGFNWQFLGQTCGLHTGNNKNNTPQTAENEIVYIGPLKPLIKAVKTLSLTTSAFGLFLQPFLLSSMWSSSTWIIFTTGFLTTLFIFGTPLLFHLITKKYIIQLDFDPEKKQFTAQTMTIFLRTKHLTFTASDVHIPAIPGLFTTFVAKNQALFIDPRIIKNPEAFQHMMGYDKPLDLELGFTSKENSDISK